MNADFIEAILLWNSNGLSEQVVQWLLDHGFQITQMQAGLLICGTQEQFEEVFMISLSDKQLPFEFPIPPEIDQNIESIGIPNPRTY